MYNNYERNSFHQNQNNSLHLLFLIFINRYIFLKKIVKNKNNWNF